MYREQCVYLYLVVKEAMLKKRDLKQAQNNESVLDTKEEVQESWDYKQSSLIVQRKENKKETVFPECT